MDLLPPPSDGVYVSFNQLLEYLNKHSTKQEYTFIIKLSKKNKKQELLKVWLQFDKRGEYKGKRKEKGICQISSRRDECQWKAIATRDTELKTWTFQRVNNERNHPLTFPGAHSIYRKKAMTDNDKMTIVSQTQANSSARQILATLRLGTDKENLLFKPKYIYNQRAYHRLTQLGPYIPSQALMMGLNKRKDYWMTYKLDEDFCI